MAGYLASRRRAAFPITPSVSGTNPNAAGAFSSGPLGTGVTRLRGYRNDLNYRRTLVLDALLSKRVPFGDHYSVELFGEMFNALNHVNITASALPPTLSAAPLRPPRSTSTSTSASTTTPTLASSTARVRCRSPRASTSRPASSVGPATPAATSFLSPRTLYAVR
jgi:hypothetical protein